MPKAQGGWTTAGEIPLFGYVGGFVLRPEAFAERGGVLCGYPYDPHTFNYKCIPPGLSETCVPGCCCGGSKGAPAWVKGFIGATAYFQDAYKPGDLRSMLADYVNRAPGNARGYNEVIVNEARWHGQLPHSFDAMFFPATTKCAEDAACEQHTRDAHAAFLHEYPESDLPLLALDPTNFESPFAVPPARVL